MFALYRAEQYRAVSGEDCVVSPGYLTRQALVRVIV